MGYNRFTGSASSYFYIASCQLAKGDSSHFFSILLYLNYAIVNRESSSSHRYLQFHFSSLEKAN